MTFPSRFCSPYHLDYDEYFTIQEEQTENLSKDKDFGQEWHSKYNTSYIRYNISSKVENKKHIATSFHTAALTPKLSLMLNETDGNVTFVLPSDVDNTKILSQGFVDQSVELKLGLRFGSDGIPGASHSFLLMVHVMMLASDFPENVTSSYNKLTERLDMMNTLPSNIITVLNPVIHTNSQAVVTLTIVVACIVAFLEFGLFACILRYREHKVMQLSQWPLLATMTFVAALASLSTISAIPFSHTICLIHSVLVTLPVTMVGCILLAKVWRIYCILAPAMSIGSRLTQKHSADLSRMELFKNSFLKSVEDTLMESLRVLSEFNPFFCYKCLYKRETSCEELLPPSSPCLGINSYCCCRKKEQNDRSSSQTHAKRRFRNSISLSQVFWLTGVLMIPQLIMQICHLTVPQLRLYAVNVYDPAIGQGQCACVSLKSPPDTWIIPISDVSTSYGHSSNYIGGIISVLPYLVACLVAYFARKLPSLFNETSQIFRATGITILVYAIGFPLMALTSSGVDSSPDANLFIRMIMVHTTVLSPCYIIVVSKLRLIWSSQNIVVSQLLSSKRNVSMDHSTNSLEQSGETSIKFPKSKNVSSFNKHVNTLSIPATGLTKDVCKELQNDVEAVDRSDCPVWLPNKTVSFVDETLGNSLKSFGEEDVSHGEEQDRLEEILDSLPSNHMRASIDEAIPVSDDAKRRRFTTTDLIANEKSSDVRKKSEEPIRILLSEPLPGKFERNMLRMREVLVQVSNHYLTGVQVRKGELEDLCAHASKFGRICERVQIVEENAIANEEHYQPEKA